MESLDTSIIFLLGGITGLVSICMAFYQEPLEFDKSLYELRGSNYFIFSLLKYFLLNSLFVTICSSLYLILFSFFSTSSIEETVKIALYIFGFSMFSFGIFFITYGSFYQTMTRFPKWLMNKTWDKKNGDFIYKSYINIGAAFWMYVTFCIFLAPIIHAIIHWLGFENHNVVNWYFNEVTGSPIHSDDFNILHFLSFYDFGLGFGAVIGLLGSVLFLSFIGYAFIKEDNPE